MFNLYTSNNFDSDICEVMDSSNKPVCLMEKTEILRQNLYHRSVALLLRSSTNQILLKGNYDEGFDFSSFDSISAGWSSYDFCSALMQRDWGIEIAPLRKRGMYKPCAENKFSFATIYEIKISPALLSEITYAKPDCLCLDKNEYVALLVRKFPLSPFLQKIFCDGVLF